MEDIQSIKQTYDSVKKLVDVVFAVMEDGKVTIGDATKVPTLISELRKLIEAAKGIGPEAKDLDGEELKEVIEGAVDLVLHLAEKFGVKSA